MSFLSTFLGTLQGCRFDCSGAFVADDMTLFFSDYLLAVIEERINFVELLIKNLLEKASV